MYIYCDNNNRNTLRGPRRRRFRFWRNISKRSRTVKKRCLHSQPTIQTARVPSEEAISATLSADKCKNRSRMPRLRCRSASWANRFGPTVVCTWSSELLRGEEEEDVEKNETWDMYVHRYRCYDAAVDPFFFVLSTTTAATTILLCKSVFFLSFFFFCFSLITVSFCVVTFPYQIKNEQRIKWKTTLVRCIRKQKI